MPLLLPKRKYEESHRMCHKKKKIIDRYQYDVRAVNNQRGDPLHSNSRRGEAES
jgi:hypothetical protein